MKLPSSQVCKALALAMWLALSQTAIGEEPRTDATGDSRVKQGGTSADLSRTSPSWPFLRGPSFDGHSRETGLVDSFPPQGPPVLWTRTLGAGYSGFTAEEDRVFTQYQTLGGQYVICLHADTRETLWEYRYEAPHDPAGLYPGPRATPTLAGGRLYFAAPSGLVGCLDSITGRLVWSMNVFAQFGVKPVEFGYSCSPVVVGEKLLLPVGQPGASMVALHRETGRPMWKSGDDPVSHVPALPIQLQGRGLVIGYLRNTLVAFDLKTGEIHWRRFLSTGYDEHAAWPIYSEPYLWISAPFQAGSELLELTADPPGCRTVWASKLLSNDVCSSILVDGHLYGFDLRDVQTKPHRPSRGEFRCLEYLTGQQRWSNGSATQRRSLESSDDADANALADRPVGQATVLYADGKLILFNDVGELVLARASPERYQELGRVRVLGGEICWTQPTLYRGRLYVRNHSRAACIVLGKESRAAGPLLSLDDIPQTAYRDWAAALIPVEPQYAMDAPTVRQLWRWYLASLAAAVLAGAATGLIAVGCRITRMMRGTPNNWASARSSLRLLHMALLLSFGAAGTTIFSTWLGEFVFTWPLCLFVLFQAAVYQTRRPSEQPESKGWQSVLVLCLFLAGCLAYFFICRRLSLVCQWAFLIGFAAAIPPLFWARWQSRRPRLALAGEWFLLLVAFTAYYWASTGVLLWKYGPLP
jgi:hypothetical protein